MTNVIQFNAKTKPQPKELTAADNSLVEELDYMMTSTVDLMGFICLTIDDLPSNSPEHFAEAKADMLALLRSHKRTMKTQRKRIDRDGFEHYDTIIPVGLWRDDHRSFGEVIRCTGDTDSNVVVLYRDTTPLDYFIKAIDALGILSMQYETISTAGHLDKELFQENVLTAIDCCIDFMESNIEKVKSITYENGRKEPISYFVMLNEDCAPTLQCVDHAERNESNRELMAFMEWENGQAENSTVH